MDAPLRPRPARRRLAHLALAALVPLGLAACSDDPDIEGAVGESETVVEQAEEEGFADLIEGEDIELTGTVTELLSDHAFILQDNLVVTGDPFSLEEGETTRVQGVVRSLDVAELEDDLGVDLDEEELEGAGSDLVIVADSVEGLDDGDG